MFCPWLLVGDGFTKNKHLKISKVAQYKNEKVPSWACAGIQLYTGTHSATGTRQTVLCTLGCFGKCGFGCITRIELLLNMDHDLFKDTQVRHRKRFSSVLNAKETNTHSIVVLFYIRTAFMLLITSTGLQLRGAYSLLKWWMNTRTSTTKLLTSHQPKHVY